MTRKFRAASRRRAKTIGGAIALLAALACVVLAACGHYGPPVPPARDKGGGYAPLPEPDAPEILLPNDPDQDRHER